MGMFKNRLPPKLLPSGLTVFISINLKLEREGNPQGQHHHSNINYIPNLISQTWSIISEEEEQQDKCSRCQEFLIKGETLRLLKMIKRSRCKCLVDEWFIFFK